MHFIHRDSTFLFVILSIDEFFSAIMKKFELIKFLQNVDDMLKCPQSRYTVNLFIVCFLKKLEIQKLHIVFIYRLCSI